MNKTEMIKAIEMMTSIAYNMAHEENLSSGMRDQWMEFWRQFNYLENW